MDRELLLLGVLRQQEMHGYQLHELISRDMACCVDLKKPTAYYLLKKMEESGLVSQETSQEGNRPPRQVYRLTDEGEAEFRRLLRQNLAGHSPARFADDIGLAFVDALEPTEAIALLAERRALMADALAATRSALPHGGSLHLVIEHQARHLTAELDWLDEVMAQLATV